MASGWNSPARSPAATRGLSMAAPAWTGRLLHAIGNLGRELTPALKAGYMSADQITAAASGGTHHGFRCGHMDLDMLLLDHIEVLKGIPVVQGEVSRILARLRRNCSQIVLACDRAPAQMKVSSKGLSGQPGEGLSIALETG